VVNLQHAIPVFHALAIGLQHILPSDFQNIAKQYHHHVLMTSLMDFSLKNYSFKVFLISQNQKDYKKIIYKNILHFSQSIFVIICEDKEKAKELYKTDFLFFILDLNNPETIELTLHQMWRWLLVLNYYKIGHINSNISIAGGQLSLINETYEKNNKIFNLTLKQISILKILLEYRGDIVSRKMLLERIWTPDKIVTDRVIDTNIVAIRKMFQDDGRNPKYLQTIFGQGYRLNND